MFYRIRSVSPLPETCLLVSFLDNTVKKYDMNTLIEKAPAFFPLREKLLFRQFQVNAGGYGVSWNDAVDLSCNELWEHGELQGQAGTMR